MCAAAIAIRDIIVWSDGSPLQPLREIEAPLLPQTGSLPKRALPQASRTPLRTLLYPSSRIEPLPATDAHPQRNFSFRRGLLAGASPVRGCLVHSVRATNKKQCHVWEAGDDFAKALAPAGLGERALWGVDLLW